MSLEESMSLTSEQLDYLQKILTAHNYDDPDLFYRFSRACFSISEVYKLSYSQIDHVTKIFHLSEHKSRLKRLHKHASAVKKELVSMKHHELQVFAIQIGRFAPPDPVGAIEGLNASASWMNWLADATETVIKQMGTLSPGQPLRKSLLHTIRYMAIHSLALEYRSILGKFPSKNRDSLFHELALYQMELITGEPYQDLGNLVRAVLSGKEIPDPKKYG